MDMQNEHQANYSKVQECITVLDTVPTAARIELVRFLTNIRKCWADMDNEMVECRRRQRVTHKYTELQTEFDGRVQHFEQWIVMAKLMY
jgi:hypothetical protein